MLGVVLSKGRGADDELNTITAGTVTGALYKSPGVFVCVCPGVFVCMFVFMCYSSRTPYLIYLFILFARWSAKKFAWGCCRTGLVGDLLPL